MDLQNLLDKVDNMYVFALNSQFYATDEIEYNKLEEECIEVLNAIRELKQNRDYYFNKLNDIKDLVVCNEDPLAKQIVEVLDE